MKKNRKISLKRFLKTALVMALLAMTFLGFADMSGENQVCAASKGVKISKKNFPDAGFRKGVRTKFDCNKDGYLSDWERILVTEIDKSIIMYQGRNGWKKKHSLKGIEFFPCLKKIRMSNINIGNPDISKNKHLEELNLYATFTTYIDVSKNIRLKSLIWVPDGGVAMVWGKKHKMKNIDVSKNVNLRILQVSHGMSQIDVTNCKKLKSLYITDGELKTLDVSQNTELESLNCSNNQLTQLDVSSCPKLRTLLCYKNQIMSLILGENLKMTWFECHKNKLAAIDMKHGTVSGVCKYDTNVAVLNCDEGLHNNLQNK